MSIMILAWLVQAVHLSHDPWGTVAQIQPPGIVAGVGDIRGHLAAWFQYQWPWLHSRGQWVTG